MCNEMAVFWVVAPCSLAEVYRRFRGACCLHHQDDVSMKKMGLRISERSKVYPPHRGLLSEISGSHCGEYDRPDDGGSKHL
jgi:hypothetical protein